MGDKKTNIFLFDDVISNDLCESIRSIIDKSDGIKTEYGPYQNVLCKKVKIKNPQLHTLIDSELYKVVSNIIHKIRETAPDITISNDNGYELRKIHGATRLHTDGVIPDKNITNDPRSLSIIIALNDDYEGGEFYFPNQDVTVKLKKGQAIAFPPYWTHPHCTNDLLNGTFRYTVNTWLVE